MQSENGAKLLGWKVAGACIGILQAIGITLLVMIMGQLSEMHSEITVVRERVARLETFQQHHYPASPRTSKSTQDSSDAQGYP